MVVRNDQHFSGSVSGGCIEGEVIRNAQSVLVDGKPRLLDFQVTNNQAWEMGLSCGGQIEVLLEKVVSEHPLIQQLESTPTNKTIWRLISISQPQQWLIDSELEGPIEGIPDGLLQQINSALKNNGSVRLNKDYFLQAYTIPPQLFIVGAVHIAQYLATMASGCGLSPVVIDPRRGFAYAERFPDITLAQQWPDQVLNEQSLSQNSALVTLSHDPKIDDPALCIALDSKPFYIAALGSQKTHMERLNRLREKGYGDRLHHIHGPAGLDLGGRAPSEIAVAILAQLIQSRYRSDQHAAA
jgi:xanthine dehydrogenase accessory factor